MLAKAPFQPKPSEKPLSEVGNFMLHSERRALERGAFEVKLKQKEAEIEGAKRELQMRKKREEEEEVARLRREAVPKAQPIRLVFKYQLFLVSFMHQKAGVNTLFGPYMQFWIIIYHFFILLEIINMLKYVLLRNHSPCQHLQTSQQKLEIPQ